MSLEWHSAVVHPRTATPPLRCASRTITPVQFQPFLQFLRSNYSRINTSKNISSFRISFIGNHLKSTRINTSGNKDLKSPRINTSGSKDLKSCRINTSKKQGRGVGCSPGGIESYSMVGLFDWRDRTKIAIWRELTKIEPRDTALVAALSARPPNRVE